MKNQLARFNDSNAFLLKMMKEYPHNAAPHGRQTLLQAAVSHAERRLQRMIDAERRRVK